MKKITLIFALLFMPMLSSTSFAEWTKVSKGADGTVHYVDFERIRKIDGFVYWWDLIDLLNPQEGILSYKVYNQGDCKFFRWKYLSFSSYKEPMSGGYGNTHTVKDDDWKYVQPNSPMETKLEQVCSQ